MKKVTLSEGDLKDLISKSLNSSEIPNDVVRYMRKNPKLIIKRLMELYGDSFFDYVGDVSNELRNEE